MFDKKKVKLGIAPIAWTNDDMPDLGSENTFEQCVSEMALAGFTGSAVGNKYPKDTKVLKHALDLRGVEICNQWFSAFLITKPFEEVEKEFRAQLAYLKEMGAKVIGASEQSYSVQGMLDTPIFGHKYVMNDEEWKIFCDGMNKLGKIAKEEYGIALTFHHHMGTVVQNADEVQYGSGICKSLIRYRTFRILWRRPTGNGEEIRRQNQTCTSERHQKRHGRESKERRIKFLRRSQNGNVHSTWRRRY